MTKNIFDRLAQAEKEFQNSEFVAPIFSDRVAVNIAGITAVYAVRPSNFRGWAILRPMADKLARVTAEAPRQLINKYLEVLPRFTMVICDLEKRLGFISSTDNRISITQPLPFHLAENIELFDEIQVRFDGSRFVYENVLKLIPSRMLKRECIKGIEDNKDPNPALNKGYREAYEYVYYKKQKEILGNKENRIKAAGERAGGNYISYSDLNNNEIKVSYEVDGKTITSTLSDDLNVMSAGICLSGGDRAFDLQSVVTVVKEAQERGNIVVGDYYDHYNR